MTTLKLNTLSARIQAHKMALVHIVKPPVCTERARHYTEMYQQHLDKPIPVRRALALAHHLAERTIWIKHDELIVGNQASEVRAAPIFPEYTVSTISIAFRNCSPCRSSSTVRLMRDRRSATFARMPSSPFSSSSG